jgi:glycosyltransferase involved in cell wall biosynthesis
MSTKTSVITAVRNGAIYVAKAIESVLPQLERDDEFLIVDDSSTDATRAIVAQFDDRRIRWLTSPRRGVSAARNEGLRLATGEFIAFLDADDEWPPERHQAMLARFAEKPAIDAVFGRIRMQFETDARSRDYAVADGRFAAAACLPTGLFRHGLATSVGGFAEDMETGEDIDFFNRLQESGMVLDLIDRESLIYRRHASNTTNDRALVRRGFMEMLRRKLGRARVRAEGNL